MSSNLVALQAARISGWVPDVFGLGFLFCFAGRTRRRRSFMVVVLVVEIRDRRRKSERREKERREAILMKGKNFLGFL